jgi:BirA family biotin operon repressor/biotin-[acetyl-CoA-carboxylase] ligase
MFDMTDAIGPAGQGPPLDRQRILDALSTRLPKLTLRHVAETGSTNRDLAALAASGAPDWTVLVADEQTEGRGRHARSWSSPRGGLYVSVLLRIDPESAKGEVTLLPLAAGLALRDALVAAADRKGAPLEISLKWPNDLLTPGGKLAGILCETTRDNGDWLLIAGMGVNIAPLPEAARNGLDQPATSLAEEAPEAEWPREELLVGLLARMHERLHQWAEAPGQLRADWWSASALAGRTVTVKSSEGAVTGKPLGIARDGALRLETETGPVEIRAAEGLEVR